MDKPLEALQILLIGTADELSWSAVHSIQQTPARPDNGLSIAPSQSGGQKTRNGHVLRVGIFMRNSKGVIRQKIRPFKAIRGFI